MELKKRKSLILHFDSLDIIDELNKEQIADLFIAIRDYNLGKDIKLEGLMKAVFIPLKNQFDRDISKYIKKCEVNAINGSKGGRPKEAQQNPVGYSGLKNNPDKAYNKNDSNNNNINNNINNNKSNNNLVVTKVTTLKDYMYSDINKEYFINNYNSTEEHIKAEMNKFYYYRSEKKPNGKKERWQMQKTFDVNLRFHNWLKNNKSPTKYQDHVNIESIL